VAFTTLIGSMFNQSFLKLSNKSFSCNARGQLCHVSSDTNIAASSRFNRSRHTRGWRHRAVKSFGPGPFCGRVPLSMEGKFPAKGGRDKKAIGIVVDCGHLPHVPRPTPRPIRNVGVQGSLATPLLTITSSIFCSILCRFGRDDVPQTSVFPIFRRPDSTRAGRDHQGSP